MSEFVIDKNVPLPETKGRVGRKSKYRFAEMQIGDSVAIAADDAKSATTCAYTYGSRNKKKFKIRREDDQGAIRIWRVV